MLTHFVLVAVLGVNILDRGRDCACGAPLELDIEVLIRCELQVVDFHARHANLIARVNSEGLVRGAACGSIRAILVDV